MSVTIRDLMTDPDLFGNQFAGDTWLGWRALLCGFYGLPLEDEELAFWQEITKQDDAPTEPAEELWLAVGRRGGKSQCAALLAVYEAFFRDHTDRLSPGEVCTIMVMAADRKQARSVFRYITGLVEQNPMLAAMVTGQDKESLTLSNRTVIEVHTASFRSSRGYTAGAVIADEIAFWRTDDSANPDFAILDAVRPALATLQGPLIALSNPYAKRGALWEAYRAHFGQPGPVLVAQAPSKMMNPSLPQRVIDQAYARDSESASAEYGAQFRNDISAFIDRDSIERLCRPEPLELPRSHKQRFYYGFVDPTGGGQSASADEFTCCIGHVEKGVVVVDCLRALKGRPADIIKEYSVLLRSYGISEVSGDRYAGYFAHDEFEKYGIRYRFTDERRTGLYQYALGVINSGAVELPPCEKMINQFCNLERRVSRSGTEQIDHGTAKGSHDDRANAIAGLIYTAHRVGAPIQPIKVRWAH